MKVKFKVPLILGGISYPPGVHEVDNGQEKHWFFLAHVANGNIVVLSRDNVSASPQAKAVDAVTPCSASTAEAVKEPEVVAPAEEPMEAPKAEEKTEDVKKSKKRKG
jgi:hypothetical protein